LVAAEDLGDDERRVLESLGTVVAGEPFVPGLYRMLARWPAYLAHVATVLAPRFDHPATRAACADLLARVDAAVPGVLDRLPGLPEEPAPPAAEFPAVLAAIDRYRETSPQMVVFSTLLRDACAEWETVPATDPRS
jgi:hypothetical protein